MNWEEAKQKVAEKEGYNDWKDMQRFVDVQFELDCVTEAAELYQQSNLDRIKELEDGLKRLSAHLYARIETDDAAIEIIDGLLNV